METGGRDKESPERERENKWACVTMGTVQNGGCSLHAKMVPSKAHTHIHMHTNRERVRGTKSRSMACLDAHYLRLRCTKGIQHKLAGAALASNE